MAEPLRSSAIRWIGDRLVSLYPRAWRQRYEAEVLAFIDAAGLTWPQVLDLAGGCVDAWIRKLLQPFGQPGHILASGLGAFTLTLSGAVAVRLLSNALRLASWIPLQSLEGIGTMAFGAVFFIVSARVAWALGGHRWKLEDAGLSSREVRALVVIILITAVAADLYRPAPIHLTTPTGSGDHWVEALVNFIPYAPLMALNVLLLVQLSSKSARRLARIRYEERPRVLPPLHPLGLGSQT
jgi:hypothetical protein